MLLLSQRELCFRSCQSRTSASSSPHALRLLYSWDCRPQRRKTRVPKDEQTDGRKKKENKRVLSGESGAH